MEKMKVIVKPIKVSDDLRFVNIYIETDSTLMLATTITLDDPKLIIWRELEKCVNVYGKIKEFKEEFAAKENSDYAAYRNFYWKIHDMLNKPPLTIGELKPGTKFRYGECTHVIPKEINVNISKALLDDKVTTFNLTNVCVSMFNKDENVDEVLEDDK